MSAAELDIERLATVLRRVEDFEGHDVAHEIAAAGVLVLPTVPGDKAPLLTKEHTESCPACRSAGLHGERAHGATTDPELIHRYWTAHPDAGVGMKEHPQLLRLDGDHGSAAAMKAARKAVGYGREEDQPLRAPTPGGRYRERVIHLQPEGQTLGGGGTPACGYSCYGRSGYVVVKGQHPNGYPYRNFAGARITIAPLALVAALARHRSDNGEEALTTAMPSEVKAFLKRNTGTERLGTLTRRRRLGEQARHGERHVIAMRELALGFKDALAGWVPAALVRDTVRDGLADAGWETERFGKEFDGMVAWAVAQVANLDADTVRQEADDRIRAAADRDLVPPEDDGARDLTLDELDAIEAAQQPSTGRMQSESEPKDLPSPVDWHALFAREVEDEDWLVEGIWPARRAISIVAQYKAGKSLLLFYIAACLALGIDPWTGRRRTPVTVAYFDMEMTEDDVHERAVDFGLKPEDLARFRYYLLPDLPPLDTPEGGKAVLELCRRDGIQAAMFDTFSRVLAGPEDLSDTIAAYNRWTAIHLKAEGIATARADHVGHTEKNRARGSSSKGADVDVAWVLSRNGNTSRLDHHGISRIRWVPRQLDVVMLEGPPDRYRRGIDGGVPEGTKACADLLDRLGIPVDHGRLKARKALTAAGEKATNMILTAAIKYRKDRENLSVTCSDRSPVDLSGTGPAEMHPEQGADRSTDRSGQVPSPIADRSGSVGPDRSARTTCPRCGDEMEEHVLDVHLATAHSHALEIA